MKESKMFLKDFITPAKIKKYVVYMFIFAVLIKILFKDKTIFCISDSASSIIGISVAFTSTAYVIYTYSTLENIKLYLTLPITKWRIFGAYFMSLWICSVIQRISFIIIVIANFSSNIMQKILLLLINSGVAVFINIGILLGKNAKKKSIVLWNFISICIMLVIGNSELKFGYKSLISIFMGISSVYTYRKMEITDLVINHGQRKKVYRKGIVNYFFRVSMTEKIYIVNTICIIAFLIVLCVISRKNPIMINLTWCIGSINTPFLTMVSGDKWIARHIDMLPVKQNNIYKQYSLFLAGYFILINIVIILSKYAILNRFMLNDIFLALLLVFLETALAGILERNYRIKGWQTKQELWKNPRKYILPLVVFIYVSIYYTTLQFL